MGQNPAPVFPQGNLVRDIMTVTRLRARTGRPGDTPGQKSLHEHGKFPLGHFQRSRRLSFVGGTGSRAPVTERYITF